MAVALRTTYSERAIDLGHSIVSNSDGAGKVAAFAISIFNTLEGCYNGMPTQLIELHKSLTGFVDIVYVVRLCKSIKDLFTRNADGEWIWQRPYGSRGASVFFTGFRATYFISYLNKMKLVTVASATLVKLSSFGNLSVIAGCLCDIWDTTMGRSTFDSRWKARSAAQASLEETRKAWRLDGNLLEQTKAYLDRQRGCTDATHLARLAGLNDLYTRALRYADSPKEKLSEEAGKSAEQKTGEDARKSLENHRVERIRLAEANVYKANMSLVRGYVAIAFDVAAITISILSLIACPPGAMAFLLVSDVTDLTDIVSFYVNDYFVDPPTNINPIATILA